MKPFHIAAFMFLLATAAPLTHASGAVGIYGIIEKVTFAPNAQSPDRVQVQGAFVVFDRWVNGAPRTAVPARGYLSFQLPVRTQEAEVARREWADLASVAGTGTAVAFSSFSMWGGFESNDPIVYVAQPIPDNVSQQKLQQLVNDPYLHQLRIWPVGKQTAAALPYSPTGGTGVVRLGKGNHDEIIEKLRKLLAK